MRHKEIIAQSSHTHTQSHTERQTHTQTESQTHIGKMEMWIRQKKTQKLGTEDTRDIRDIRGYIR